jgi:carbamoyl-phosphate synthase small subunit
MKYSPPQIATLVLEDGSFFSGYALGKIGTTGGEICFNTGMTGYQEIYTDPSYYGQIIVNTVSHIGNYGVLSTEQESQGVKFSGLVCDSFSIITSRAMATESLQQYLEKAGIVGIWNVDTRKIVRHIRSKGAMNALISSDITDKNELLSRLKALPSMLNLELSSVVTTKESYILGNEHTATFKVAVLDFGIKKSILDNLLQRNCVCKVFPAKTTAQEVLEWQPDGIFLSNGPGDPAAMEYAVKTAKQLIEKGKPVFGICLGHQIIALANDIPTYKMHHGHRGINHPVKNLITGLCEITSQNHGFAVSVEALQKHKEVEVTHINLNDNTIEGIRMKNKPVFSVQYHPESAPGPHDSAYLFDQFVENMQAELVD